MCMLIELIKNITFDKALPSLTELEIKGIFTQQLAGKLSSAPLVILSDANYTTITEQKVRQIYYNADLRKTEYDINKHDCDDFSVRFKGELAKAVTYDWDSKYAYAAGIVFGYIPTPHAINWFITPEKKLMFFEPQTGEVFEPRGKNIFFLFS